MDYNVEKLSDKDLGILLAKVSGEITYRKEDKLYKLRDKAIAALREFIETGGEVYGYCCDSITIDDEFYIDSSMDVTAHINGRGIDLSFSTN